MTKFLSITATFKIKWPNLYLYKLIVFSKRIQITQKLKSIFILLVHSKTFLRYITNKIGSLSMIAQIKQNRFKQYC